MGILLAPLKVFYFLKGWKTIIFSFIVAGFGVAETLDWTEVFSDETAGAILAFVGLVNFFLRMVTNTPVAKKSSLPPGQPGTGIPPKR